VCHVSIDINLASTLVSSGWSSLFRFSNQTLYKFLTLPLRNCYLFGLSHFKLLCDRNICVERFILFTQSAMQFSPTFCYFFLPSTNDFPGLFSGPLQTCGGPCFTHIFLKICKIVSPKYWRVRLVALHVCVVHVTESIGHLPRAFWGCTACQRLYEVTAPD